MPHMDRAFLIFQHEGKDYRLKVTEPLYREFQKSNPALEHHLECPDFHCRGKVYAHVEAKNIRKDADHFYTRAGFSHHKNEAKKGCKYSFKNFDATADLEDTAKYLPQTRAMIDAALDRYRLPLLEVLQELLGTTVDARDHFSAMRAHVIDHEFYATNIRAAPYTYVPTLLPFEMGLKNGKVILATYLESDQQKADFRSELRSHVRTEILPRSVQLVYVPELRPVATYRFDIMPRPIRENVVKAKEDITRIFRDMAAGPRHKGQSGISRIIEVKPDAFIRARRQRTLLNLVS